MMRSARCCRSSPEPASSHSTTTLAPISMRESRPNPASATERALSAAKLRTTTPTTFHPSVTASSSRPRRSSRAEVDAVEVLVAISEIVPCRRAQRLSATAGRHDQGSTKPRAGGARPKRVRYPVSLIVAPVLLLAAGACAAPTTATPGGTVEGLGLPEQVVVPRSRIKIIRAPGGCTNPWQRAATVSIRALVFPYTAGKSAILARFTLNQDRRCRWFKSPSGHAVCAGQRPTPLFLVPPWLPPQTLKRTDAFRSRQSRCWSPPGPPLVVARWRQRSLQSRG